MGKPLIQQRRGKGFGVYRVPSFNFPGAVMHPVTKQTTVKGIITDILHSGGHSAPLLEVKYENGVSCLQCAPQGVRIGEEIIASGREVLEPKPGNIMPLRHMPEGTIIHNLESKPGDGGRFVRSAGSAARVLAKFEDYVEVLLPSKKRKNFLPDCRAAVGVIAGGGRLEKPFYKAGKRYHRMRVRNKRYPRVAGLAMNAVNHPYGGSRTHKKNKPTIARRDAPPGAKVGMLRPRRTGRRKR